MRLRRTKARIHSFISCHINEQHQNESPLRRGLKVLHPYIERLQMTIDLVSPFASIEPTATTALGLIKGVTSLSIAICGAAEDLTEYITSFLERIPAIDRCMKVVVNKYSQMPHLYNTLVNVYKDLFHFYLKTIAIFKDRVALRIVMSALKQDLLEIISSFNKHADVLSELLQSETFAASQEVKDELVDTLIRDTLDINREDEIAFHNELKQRANEACSWINSEIAFSDWISIPHGSNIIAMFGDMGCGKTMTTAFVADYLLSQNHPVCSYYCKDGQETTTLGIYRSILWQLLQQRPCLKSTFYDWYNKGKNQSQVNPTQSNERLHAFICETISLSKEWIFIVLDGLDECDVTSQTSLFSLFNDLFKHGSRLKVFISSRYDDDIKAALPSGATQIELPTSRARDRHIAAYLVDQYRFDEQIREYIIDKLSEEAKGSAIWLRIAIEVVKSYHVRTLQEFQSVLMSLPSSSTLAKLYWNLFQRMCPENDANIEDYLEKALETLAVARRPLSQKELYYAVHIDDSYTMPELDEAALSLNLFSFIRPFVSTINEESADGPQLRLIHQSLKELVLQGPPSTWGEVKNRRGGSRAKEVKERRAKLNGDLLGRCIKYLLYNECQDKSLLSNFEHGDGELELLAIGNVLDNDTTPTETGPLKLSQKFDPVELGFGFFFTYAASYWTSHFSDTAQELRPSPENLLILCKRGSQRLQNWVEQYRRPNCSYIPELNPIDLDPLIVAAIFGPEASIFDILDYDAKNSEFAENAAWAAVEQLVVRNKPTTIQHLLGHPALKSMLCCTELFYGLLTYSHSQSYLRRDLSKEWEDFFAFLIGELRDDVIQWGNGILCRAAGNGCFVLVKTLFDAAAHDPDLREGILDIDTNRKGRRNQHAFVTHQSIGEAIYNDHINIVHFLSRQSGIGPHLRYINEHGQTVFHQAARHGSTEIFRFLIKEWPEGINLINSSNDTPLSSLIFANPHGDKATVETVSILLSLGKADASGFSDEPWHSPLCSASRRGNISLCRILVLEGSADLSYAVGVDDETRKPFLKAEAKPQADDGRMLLKELCSLLPLSVSTEYLF